MNVINIEATTFEAMMNRLPALRLAYSLSLGIARASTALLSLLRRFESFAERVESLCRENGDKSLQTWLDTQEVCELLGVQSKRTIQSYRDSGLLPYSRIEHKIYYRPEDVQRMLERLNKQKPN